MIKSYTRSKSSPLTRIPWASTRRWSTRSTSKTEICSPREIMPHRRRRVSSGGLRLLWSYASSFWGKILCVLRQPWWPCFFLISGRFLDETKGICFVGLRVLCRFGVATILRLIVEFTSNAWNCGRLRMEQLHLRFIIQLSSIFVFRTALVPAGFVFYPFLHTHQSDLPSRVAFLLVVC